MTQVILFTKSKRQIFDTERFILLVEVDFKTRFEIWC